MRLRSASGSATPACLAISNTYPSASGRSAASVRSSLPLAALALPLAFAPCCCLTPLLFAASSAAEPKAPPAALLLFFTKCPRSGGESLVTAAFLPTSIHEYVTPSAASSFSSASGLREVVASFAIGWKWHSSCCLKPSSRKNTTFLAPECTTARGVALPRGTPSAVVSCSSFAKRSPDLPWPRRVESCRKSTLVSGRADSRYRFFFLSCSSRFFE
mmetsp:Transcript_16303/g.50615  ORF Transcript_16303/g.50615 Transcript_16303/m.50615 type:complete len:216 (+) Transcript_16303:299-946(+)